MQDDQDPVISQLFSEQAQSLPPDGFVLQLGKRIGQRQRKLRFYRVFAIAACLLLAILSSPWVAQTTSTLIELTADGGGTIGPLFYAPLTWILAGATAAGCSPVIYLWRTGRW